MIQVGAYAFELTSKKSNANSYVYVQIDSKCRDEQTLPFQTKCWTSSGTNQNFRFTVVLKDNNLHSHSYHLHFGPYFILTGSSDFDAGDSDTRLAILAQVTQGNNPVLDAKVE